MSNNNLQNADQLFELGLQCMRGDGVPANPFTAVRYFKEALTLGHQKAAQCLGEASYLGLGIEKDERKAEEYFYKFVSKNTNKVPFTWKWLKNNVEFNNGLSFDDYYAAASIGNIDAQRYLMHVYSGQCKIMYNDKQHAYWAEKVASTGDIVAQKAIGQCYHLGLGVKQDLTQAKKWYTEVLTVSPNDPSALRALNDIQYIECESHTAANSVIKDGILIKYNGTEKKIYIPQCVSEIGVDAFYGNENIEEVYAKYIRLSSIKAWAFAKCRNLRIVELPSSVKEIGECAFFDTHLNEILLPRNIEIIGKAAFACTHLHRIYTPENVQRIDESAFAGCTELSYAGFLGAQEIGPSAFEECGSLKNVHLPSTLEIIGPSAFKNCHCLTSIFVPESVEKIDSTAFEGCHELKTVNASEQWKNSHPDLLRCILKEV